ncbi:MAG: peptidyl-prolyl cis-trans isomerase [Armatimonadota bacterium]
MPRRQASALLALCGIALALAASCGGRGGTVATVEGHPIRADDYRAELRRSHGEAVLRSIIFDKLLERRARELGLEVGQAQRERLLRVWLSRGESGAEHQQPSGVPRSGAGVTEQDLDRARQARIAEAGSPGDLERLLRRQGMDEADFARDLYRQALFERVLGLSVRATPDEIQRFYETHKDEYRRPEQVRVRLMMLGSKANADELRAVLDLPGSDFAGLAQAFSTDPGTKDKGGDTGWFGPGDYAEAIETQAYALKKEGQISPVFEAPDGWCILKLIGRRPGGVQPLDEVRERVRGRVLQLKRRQAEQAWFREQWQRTDIEILAPDLQDLTPPADEEGAPQSPLDTWARPSWSVR